jgi:hypothetical protein
MQLNVLTKLIMKIPTFDEITKFIFLQLKSELKVLETSNLQPRYPQTQNEASTPEARNL